MEIKTIKSCSKLSLMELGFVPGTEVVIVTKVFGVVVLYFRGTKYALRTEDFNSLSFF
jgi:Fe2+ transport system protein FeoA